MEQDFNFTLYTPNKNRKQVKTTWKQLNISDVFTIRSSKEASRFLAKRFNRTTRQIRYIRARRCWRFATD